MVMLDVKEMMKFHVNKINFKKFAKIICIKNNYFLILLIIKKNNFQLGIRLQLEMKFKQKNSTKKRHNYYNYWNRQMNKEII